MLNGEELLYLSFSVDPGSSKPQVTSLILMRSYCMPGYVLIVRNFAEHKMPAVMDVKSTWGKRTNK